MRYRLILIIGSLSVAVGLASCSTGARSHASGAASSASNDQGSIAAIVRCFRAHGAPNFPDPIYDPGDGRWHFATSPASVPASTREACQGLFPSATPAPPVSQARFEQLVSFAECMRRNGVYDWPDPGPDGFFHLDARLIALGKSGAVGRAVQTCPFPTGGIQVMNGS